MFIRNNKNKKKVLILALVDIDKFKMCNFGYNFPSVYLYNKNITN